jgi:hypothetical protein
MTEENNINKLFQDVFENLEVTPPVSVKMEIDKQLGPKRRFRFIFWWLPVLVLLLSGIAFAVVHYSLDESGRSPVVSQVGSAPVEDDKSAEDKSADGSKKEFVREKQENDQKERVKTIPEESSKRSVQGERKLQKLTLKKGGFTQVAQNESTPLLKVKKNGVAKSSNSKKLKKGSKIIPVDKSASISKGLSDTSGNPKQKPDEEKGNLPDTQEKTTAADENPKVEASPGKDKELKTDSSATAVTADSLVKPAEDPAKVKPLNDASKAKNWMIELYGGPRFGAKTSKTEFALKEATSYQIGLGFSRRLELGPLKYVTLDGEYGSGKESYKQDVTTTSIYFVGIDSIPYFDTIPGDTIPLGYTYYNVYDTLTNTTENNTNAAITRFAFGLKAQLNFNLGAGFGLAVTPGYYYSISKYKFSNDTIGSRSSSSSQILLGLGVYYDWNRFRFRVGLDTRYELMSKNNNLFIDRRKSMLFSPQFGIAVKF